jgi:hypothetical protein
MRDRYTRDGSLTKDNYTGLLWDEKPILQVGGEELFNEGLVYETPSDGWRVPSIGELRTLWETTPQREDGWIYWTSSSFGRKNAWTVDFSDGTIRTYSLVGHAALILVKDLDRKV